ncbi:hypothetical protein D3C75_1116640 [compost metagenome]
MNALPDDITLHSLHHGYHEDFYKTNIKSENVERIMNLGLHETSHIIRNLRNYINTPFEEIVNSNNPIYKAFGLIDRRLGKRRFRKIEITENEHPLVKIFFELRKDIFDS